MKSFLYLFIVSLALLGSEVNAQSAKGKTVSTVTKKGCFKDANKNKVCDKYESGTCVKAKSHVNNRNVKDESLCNGSGIKKVKSVKTNKK